MSLTVPNVVSSEEQRIKNILKSPQAVKEKVKLIDERIHSVEEQLKNPYTMLAFAFSKSPKHDIINSWALCLEARHELINDPEDISEISTIIKKRFEDLGYRGRYDYIHMVLPAKYKNRDKQHALDLLKEEETRRTNDLSENSSLTPEMQRFCNVILKHVETMLLYHKKIQESSAHTIPEQELARFNRLSEGIDKSNREVLDSRVKVLKHHFNQMFMAEIITTKNFTYSVYLKYVKEFAELTGKQALKILSGRTTRIPEEFEPATEQDARYANFLGQRCPDCDNLRTEVRYNESEKDMQMKCYACNSWNFLKRYKLLSRII